jgi:hypothetical protein
LAACSGSKTAVSAKREAADTSTQSAQKRCPSLSCTPTVSWERPFTAKVATVNNLEIVGLSVMNAAKPAAAEKTYSQRLLAGCGLLLIIFFFVVAFALVALLNRDRGLAQYPGSTPLSTHSNYASLSRAYRWDDTFRTQDDFTAVYNWYSINFDMGAEARANGNCILLETNDQFFRAQRFMSVFIRGTPEGQLVFVSHTTTFKKKGDGRFTFVLSRASLQTMKAVRGVGVAACCFFPERDL